MVKLLTLIHHLLNQERDPEFTSLLWYTHLVFHLCSLSLTSKYTFTQLLMSMIITNLSFSGVEVNHLNTVVVSIHPVQNALGNVQCQAIRP